MGGVGASREAHLARARALNPRHRFRRGEIGPQTLARAEEEAARRARAANEEMLRARLPA